MFRTVSRTQVNELLTRSAQIVEVLDGDQFRWAHLPGAVHLAADDMTRERVASALDPARPTVVYSRDPLCDLSPRAACLLDVFGFSEVYHYAGGKADWLASGMSVEGEAGPVAAQEAAPMPTLPWDYTVGDARVRLGDRWPEEHPGHELDTDHEGHDHGHADHEHGHGDHDHDHGHDHDQHDHDEHVGGPGDDGWVAVVLGPGEMVIGAVDHHGLAHGDDDTSILDVMRPVPPTVSGATSMSDLLASGQARVVVTTHDGQLLGEVDVDAARHEHDDPGAHVAAAPAGGSAAADDDLNDDLQALLRLHFGPGHDAT